MRSRGFLTVLEMIACFADLKEFFLGFRLPAILRHLGEEHHLSAYNDQFLLVSPNEWMNATASLFEQERCGD